MGIQARVAFGGVALSSLLLAAAAGLVSLGVLGAVPAAFARFDARLLANPVIVMERQALLPAALVRFDPRLLANPMIVMDRQ